MKSKQLSRLATVLPLLLLLLGPSDRCSFSVVKGREVEADADEIDARSGGVSRKLALRKEGKNKLKEKKALDRVDFKTVEKRVARPLKADLDEGGSVRGKTATKKYATADIEAVGVGKKKKGSAAATEDDTIDGRSLALVSAGCAGSTAVIEFARKLLNAHGWKVEGGLTEILKPETNKFWDSAMEKLESGKRRLKHDVAFTDRKWASEEYPYQDVIVEAMRQTIDDSASKDHKLLFKAPPGFLDGKKKTDKYGDGNVGTFGVLPGLKELGVAFAFHYRSNALDHMVCMIRDCFKGGGDRMYPVFATNGTRVDGMCMHRRSMDVKVKVMFEDIPHFVQSVYRLEKIKEDELDFSLTLPGVDEAFSIEDLFAYEYTDDEEAFMLSRDAWVKFISSTVEPDEAIVTEHLRKSQGKLRMKPHSDVIYNIGEVIEALKNADPPLDHYLREE